MHRQTLPGAVTLGRVVLMVESSLWMLGGLLAAGFGALIIATAWSGATSSSIVPPQGCGGRGRGSRRPRGGHSRRRRGRSLVGYCAGQPQPRSAGDRDRPCVGGSAPRAGRLRQRIRARNGVLVGPAGSRADHPRPQRGDHLGPRLGRARGRPLPGAACRWPPHPGIDGIRGADGVPATVFLDRGAALCRDPPRLRRRRPSRLCATGSMSPVTHQGATSPWRGPSAGRGRSIIAS
jgi:hypothetical protein